MFGRLASEIPTFAGIKSSHKDAQHVRSLIDAAPEQVVVLAGNERIALGLLALGVSGLISGLSTAIPEPFIRLTKTFFAGDLSSAKIQQKLINQLLDLIPPGARLGAIKEILVWRGIEAGPPVLPRPLPPPDWQPWSEVTRLMDESAEAADLVQIH
jgi:dihydrodipicolinate synthase/N-acetylneuraminate lyase